MRLMLLGMLSVALEVAIFVDQSLFQQSGATPVEQTTQDGTVPAGEQPMPADYRARLLDTTILPMEAFYAPARVGEYVVAGHSWKRVGETGWLSSNPPQIVDDYFEYRDIRFSVVNSYTYYLPDDAPRWMDYRQQRDYVTANPDKFDEVRKLESDTIPAKHLLKALTDPRKEVKDWARQVLSHQRTGL